MANAESAHKARDGEPKGRPPGIGLRRPSRLMLVRRAGRRDGSGPGGLTRLFDEQGTRGQERV